MSPTISPPRARCTDVIDGTVTCHCPWFNAPSLPSLDQFNCVCGHGIHAHVDYESKVVFHNPTTHCAAYAQKAHKSHACTCTVQLIDHEPIVNAYRSIALFHSPALIASSLNTITPSNADMIGPSSDTGTFAVTSTPIHSFNVNPSMDTNSMLFAPVPAPSHSNSVLRFSQSEAYASVYHQQSAEASLVHDLAGSPAVHHAPEGYYVHQGHSFGINGAPSTGSYA
ncbi:hypothetical protein EDD85DRAFT_496653 [Armillaria nabsnona]|nr:hypothetical protein EDD85DRAFT_496653 [Armillaria nabsnona]